MKKGIIFSLIFMIVGMISISCQAPKNTINIGAVLCLTGSGAPYGEDSERGVRLAVEEINNKGGIKGRKIKLIVEDDQTNPSISNTAVSKLINQDKVQVIIGAVTSSSMLADAPIAEKDKVVLFSPGASNPKITMAGDYIFRNWISDDLEGKAMARYLYNDEKVRKVAILYINNDYGTGLKEVFNNEFNALGGSVTIIDVYNQDDTDFKTQLYKIKNTKPERIYLPGYYKEMALILKQAKELHINIPFRSVVTFEDPELIKIAGNEAENVIYSSPYYNATATEKKVATFAAHFKEKYNREPGIFAGHGYDAMMIIADAFNTTDAFTGVKLREALYQIQNYPGVSGLTSFDKNGDVIKPVAIKKVLNKKFEFIKTINL